jgi:ferredoxin
VHRRLPQLRLAAALLVLGAFAAAFLDFRGALPPGFPAALAATQAVPAAVAAASGGAVALGVVAALVLLTLVAGRVYCSVLCPLGLLQDLVFRLTAATRRRHPGHAPARDGLRYGVLAATLGAVALGAGGAALAAADPYAHFGRIAAGLLRPLLVAANNLLVPVAQAAGLTEPYRVPVPWPAAGVALAALGTLAVVGVLAARRGRLFCNTLCPVGTLLGLGARVGLFRLAVDRDACTKCAQCLHACPAQCIDLRTGRLDASRCVACYDCVAACGHGGIAYRAAWRTDPSAEPAPVFAPEPPRRALLTGALLLGPALALRATATGGRTPAPVAPPGAGSVRRLLERCTACQLCVSACPTQVLQPALFHYGWQGFAKPRLDFERSFCNFDCRRCGEVCPTDALTTLELARKQRVSVGVARLETRLCVVETDGTDCAACSEHCPTKAVDTVPFRDNLRLPVVREELCLGCGACEFACPVRPERAIVVVARAEHTLATQAVEAPAVRPPTTGDFPF